MRRTLLLAAALMLLSLSSARAAEPTLAEAQADYAAKEYRPALQKIARVLTGPQARPGSPARYDAFLLRGECMLALKEANLASDAFNQAASMSKSNPDLTRIALARATSVLIKASEGLKYKPAAGEAIDIVDPTSRKRAMLALFEDRFAAVTPQIDAALKSDTLYPIDKLLPQLADLYALELTATGKTDRTLPAAQALGEHARNLIDAQLGRIGQRVDELNALATEPTISGGLRQDIGYRGLTSPERDELKAFADELTKIERVSQEGRRINRRIGGSGEVWDRVLGECSDVMDRAQQAYDWRY